MYTDREIHIYFDYHWLTLLSTFLDKMGPIAATSHKPLRAINRSWHLYVSNSNALPYAGPTHLTSTRNRSIRHNIRPGNHEETAIPYVSHLIRIAYYLDNLFYRYINAGRLGCRVTDRYRLSRLCAEDM